MKAPCEDQLKQSGDLEGMGQGASMDHVVISQVFIREGIGFVLLGLLIDGSTKSNE